MVRQKSSVIIWLICGTIKVVHGPVQNIVINPEYLDVTTPKNKSFTHSIKAGHTDFGYVIEGNGFVKSSRRSLITNEGLIILDDGELITIITDNERMRFLLILGKPLNELIVWYGPIVINTQEGMAVAFSDYQTGIFIKHRI
jgi:quercetin 2,3-dioxygenase